MNAADIERSLFLSPRPEQIAGETRRTPQVLDEKDCGDYADEQFAPPRGQSPIERQLRASVEFVQHPTFENFTALRSAIGGSR